MEAFLSALHDGGHLALCGVERNGEILPGRVRLHALVQVEQPLELLHGQAVKPGRVAQESV